MKILLTGGRGQIGGELRRSLSILGDLFAPSRHELDLAVPDSIVRAVRGYRPQLIVNAAAFTAVDRAETDLGPAMKINGEAPGVMAEEARRGGAVLIHYSTDYVFDGTKAIGYTEVDSPRPVNAYGRTKLEGERQIREVDPLHLILRTSWVYGSRGQNFLRTILQLAGEHEELKIVADQHGAPTWSRMIADATCHMLVRLSSPRALDLEQLRAMSGVYHMTAGGTTTWYEFALAILERRTNCARVLPVSTSEYRSAASRPLNSLLDNARLRDCFGFCLPDWRIGLQLCLEELDRR